MYSSCSEIVYTHYVAECVYVYLGTYQYYYLNSITYLYEPSGRHCIVATIIIIRNVHRDANNIVIYFILMIFFFF